MVLGQLIGDAACMACHWIYDVGDLEKRFPGGAQGFDQPDGGAVHKNKRAGDFTHYGDGAMIMLESLAVSKTFEPAVFGQAFYHAMRSPLNISYLDHATRETLDKRDAWVKANPDGAYTYQDGADDDQLATASSIAPIVAAYHDRPDLLQVVETATRVRQNNDRAVAYLKAQVRILAALLDGETPAEAVNAAIAALDKADPADAEVASRIEAATGMLDASVTEATADLGQSCPLAGSFPSALHAFLKEPTDFKTCILAVANAGGDNAGRAAITGAFLGAHLGEAGIPADWRDRLNRPERIFPAVDKLVG